jgi:hypothetical protein
LLRERFDEFRAAVVRSDYDGASVEAALPRPAPHQQKQNPPEGHQNQKTNYAERAQPDAGELIARLGKERDSDGDEKDDRPCGGEPHVLFLMTSKCLDLVDVNRLEGDHRQNRDGEYGCDIVPFETICRDDVANIDGQPRQGHQGKFHQSHNARDHNRRIGRSRILGGDCLSNRR